MLPKAQKQSAFATPIDRFESEKVPFGSAETFSTVHKQVNNFLLDI